MTSPFKTLRYRLWAAARGRAKELGLPFDLDLNDIVLPQFCPVLGLELKTYPGPMEDSSPTVDRIVPELGYVQGNIVVVSNRANRLKNNASIEELSRLASFYAQLIQ